MKILLDADPGPAERGGGDPASPTPAPGASHNLVPQPAPPPAAPAPAAPPAAETVLKGTRSERELQLEEDVKKKDETIKHRETRISELEDENHRLKQVPSPTPAPEPEDDGVWRPFKL